MVNLLGKEAEFIQPQEEQGWQWGVHQAHQGSAG